jgi:hypothetical protein
MDPRSPQWAAGMYLRIAEGPDDLVDERRSRLHKLFALFALVALLVTALMLSGNLPGPDGAPWKQDDAIAASGSDEEDEDGEPEDEDADTEAGAETGPNDTGTAGETVGNTDAGGQDTGVSTQGETDPADDTGKTEATQGTGVESQGNTDARAADTAGASTAGDSEPRDHTGKTEKVNV